MNDILRISCFSLISLFMFFTSCKDSQISNSQKKTISFSSNYIEQLKLSSFCDEIKFVPLETLNQCVIGKIVKVEIHNDNIYILDDITNSIFCFTLSGKFKFKINNVGKGPGQYIKIRDFIVNGFNNTIDIYDGSNRRILIYDIKGNFVRALNFKIGLRYFMPIDQNSYIVFTQRKTLPNENKNYSNDIIILRKDGKVINKYFPYKARSSSSSISNFQSLMSYNKNIYVNLVYSEIMYKLEEHNLVPEYYFDFGENKFPLKLDSKNYSELYNLLNKNSYAFYPVFLGENDKYVFIEYLNGNEFHYAIYNKKDNTTKIYESIDNDINKMPFQRTIKIYSQDLNKDPLIISNSIIFSHDENYMYGYLYPDEVKNLPMVFPMVKIEDNPIMIFIRLKKN